jgi:threonyl-tRNA synthetase
VVASITEEAAAYALEVTATLQAQGLRAQSDVANQKITYKIREHSLAKVPVLVIVGKREALERTVSVRRLGSQAQQAYTLDTCLELLAAEAVPPMV